MPCCATTTNIGCGETCQGSPVVSCQHHEKKPSVEFKRASQTAMNGGLERRIVFGRIHLPTFAISMFSWPLVEKRIKSILALESLTLSNYPRAIPNPAQRGVSDAHCGEGICITNSMILVAFGPEHILMLHLAMIPWPLTNGMAWLSRVSGHLNTESTAVFAVFWLHAAWREEKWLSL